MESIGLRHTSSAPAATAVSHDYMSPEACSNGLSPASRSCCTAEEDSAKHSSSSSGPCRMQKKKKNLIHVAPPTSCPSREGFNAVAECAEDQSSVMSGGSSTVTAETARSGWPRRTSSVPSASKRGSCLSILNSLEGKILTANETVITIPNSDHMHQVRCGAVQNELLDLQVLNVLHTVRKSNLQTRSTTRFLRG